jgi:hypothetical protein
MLQNRNYVDRILIKFHQKHRSQALDAADGCVMFTRRLLVIGAGATTVTSTPLIPSLVLADYEGARPAILSRLDWHAKPATDGLKPQKVIGVILHHTGVPKNRSISLQTKMQNLQAFSQKPGLVAPGHSKPAWPDVPYHFYIAASGQIAEGRDVNFAGDTNTNYETSGYIQIVVEGDFEKENPDPAQLDALRELLAWILTSRNLPIGSITVHRDHAPTTCPGRNLQIMLPKLLSELSTIRRKAASDSIERYERYPK